MIHRRYIDGRWGQVHLTEAGAGPLLMLLHQSPLSASQFLPALPYLAAAGLHVVAIDTPGFGASDPPPLPVGIIELADSLLPVLGALSENPVHILGHHTGAAIGAALAARHPGRVNRLILNGVPMFDAPTRAHFATFKFDAVVPQHDGSHLLVAWEQRLRATPGWTDIAAMHRHVVTRLANSDRGHWGFGAAFGYDIGNDLQRIKVPALILTNTGEDLYEASQAAAKLRPDWDFVALPGGTHDIVDEQPEAWAAAVAGFLLNS